MTTRLLCDDAAPVTHVEHLHRHGQLPAVVGETGRAAMLATIEHSGLVGRGGAGFPVGRKLRAVAAGAATGAPVVVANGCEGEPASRKDLWLLTRTPHLVLDGVEVAARVVGAREAHLAVHRGSPGAGSLRRALAERGKTEAFSVTVHELPPRYVASEETALVHWLNGAEAKPTFTPPRPFESGVGRRATLVNNVETLAHLALVARRGSEWFRSVGDATEPGTLLLSVSGPPQVARVVEVPTGTSVGAALALAGADLAASNGVLVGGYFGTWLRPDVAATAPLTHQGMQAVGAALGAGVVAALPATVCGVVETARVATYLAAQSAGQCGPCVNGLPAIADALRLLARGPWDERLAPALDRWLSIVPGRGACRLPDGAARFVVSALTTFAHDVAEHRAGRPCASSQAGAWLPLPSVQSLSTGWR
jgi:NADH:ubiquinone oxidoreductase subunit F (NADH-binding)